MYCYHAILPFRDCAALFEEEEGKEEKEKEKKKEKKYVGERRR
jgi:hypothetical protein